MTDDTFGALLRAARLRAGFSSIAAFADHLSTLGLEYSNEAIDHWENNRRKPIRNAADKTEREQLLRILAALVSQGGFRQFSEVNRALWLLGLRALDEQERSTHFAALARVLNVDNLPAHPQYEKLVGRDALVDTLADYLTDPTAKPVVVISGLGGIGKTALAYEVVSSVMQRGYFDQLAWESARSEDFTGTAERVARAQDVPFESLLASYARQLGFESLQQLSPEMLPSQMRRILRSGNYLLVMDNLETPEAAREIAQKLYKLVSPSAHARPTRVLLTSRTKLVDLGFAFDTSLNGLTEPDSLELLRSECEGRGAETLLTASSDLRQRIYTVTGGMPLALKLIVSQYLLGIPLDEELERLKRAVDEQELYRFIYFSLWQKLSLPAQQVLAGAAAFGASAAHAMLMQVSQVTEAQFHIAIPELVRMSLIEVVRRPDAVQQRYAIHPMTRWFVNAPLTELWNRQKSQSAANPPPTA
jgi:hypothetical protein